MNTYEALIVYYNSLNEEALPKAVDRVVGEIQKLGGEAGKRVVLGKRRFARPMKKQDSGCYVRIGFSLDPSKVNSLKSKLKFDDDIIRLQVLNVDKEPVVEKVGSGDESDKAEREGGK